MRDSNGRFVGGESGNNKGAPRKRKARFQSSFKFLLETRIQETVNGVSRLMTIEEALQQRTFADALGGMRIAERDVRKWIQKRDEYLSQFKPPFEPKTIEYQDVGPRNADSALLLLGITRPHSNGRTISGGEGPQHELETWPIEAALRKYRFKPLKKEDSDTVRRGAVDGDKLDLPGSPPK